MNERARAIALLTQARDILAERLTERLLQSRDAILEDALGLAYSSEIDAIQDQIGQRLNHINLLLSNLPPIEDAELPKDEEIVAPPPAPVLGYEPTPTERLEDLPESEFVGPPPVIYVASTVTGSEPSTFQDFLRAVMAGELDEAGTVLVALLGVNADRGRECAERFRDQLREQPHFLQKAMSLRQELTIGSTNGALLLLWECFGLQGTESLSALRTLRARLMPSASTT
jgi:hypothetical protein